jgi:16S rRNA G966 N2-methylase RsmD
VDGARAAGDAIRRNLGLTHREEQAALHRSEVLSFLRRNDKSGAPFDLVMADPPYDAERTEVEDVLRELASGWLREPGWTVVLTRASGSSMPVIPVHWAARRRLRYGDSLLTLYRED